VNSILDLIEKTLTKHVASEIDEIKIEEQPVKKGYNSQSIHRYKVIYRYHNNHKEISVIIKEARLVERKVLYHLNAQAASVPYCFADDLEMDVSANICMQDIDYCTDYSKLDTALIVDHIGSSLAHIHGANYQYKHQLGWLPFADRRYIEVILKERWKPYWDKALMNSEFVDSFKTYIPEIEVISSKIIDDMERVLMDESSHTLIHTDLHPGNVLAQNTNKVYMIDWDEAHYGSFYLDIPIQFGMPEEAEVYWGKLFNNGIEIPHKVYMERFRIASRYTGLRYMAWTLGAWADDHNNTEYLYRYLNMVVQ